MSISIPCKTIQVLCSNKNTNERMGLLKLLKSVLVEFSHRDFTSTTSVVTAGKKSTKKETKIRQYKHAVKDKLEKNETKI